MRIPDSSDLRRVTPQATTRIQSDRSGEIAGAALAELGMRAHAKYERDRQERSRFNAQVARSELLQADIDARKELETDRDWQTMPTRYQERMTKAREKAAQRITDPADRLLFDQAAKFDVERGAAEVRQLSRRMETDEGRAKLETTLVRNREAALTAKDAATRTAFVDSTLAMLDSAAKPTASGAVFMSAEEAAERRRMWTSDYGEGVIDLLPPDQQIAMLKKPDGTPAQFIPADRRAALTERAQNEIRRREAEARARQGEIRQALNDAEDDALAARAAGLPASLPSRALYSVAYGDEGAKRYGQAAQRMSVFDAVDSVLLKPRDEALAELSKYKPQQQEGAADQSRVQAAALQMYDQRRGEFEKDPVAYIIGNDARVQELLPAILNGSDKADVPAYVARVKSIQAAAGITDYKLLPDDLTERLAAELQPDPAKPGQRAARLAQVEEQWGKAFPEVLRQVVPKMEGVGQILPFVSPRVASRLDVLTADPKPVEDALSRSGQKQEVEDAVNAEMHAFDATLSSDVYTDAPERSQQFYSAAKLLAGDYVRQGASPADAAEKAVDEIVRSQYDLRGTLRIPRRENGGRGRAVDTGKVAAGALAVRSKLATDTGLKTWDGYPAVKNADGSFSTRLTATVEVEELNGGKPTNIPTLWRGKKLSESEAIKAAIQSGQAFPSFGSIDEAVAEAKRVSNAAGGAFMVTPGQFETLEDALADRRFEIASESYWAANLDDTGAVLVLPGRGVVLGADGKPVEKTWRELEKAAESQDMNLVPSPDKDLTRRSGFGGPR